MLRVRHAGFPNLRGFGWRVAVPFAILVGVIVGLASDSKEAGFTAALGVSLVGLIALSFGYSLGEIWGSYWMIPVTLAGGEIAWLAAIWDGPWAKILIGTATVVLTTALGAAISRTSEEGRGMARLLGCFIQSLIPGCYPGRRR